MAEKPQIGAQAEIDLTKWSTNIQKMLADASNVDKALAELVQAANKAEAALNSISGGQSGTLMIDVDTSEITAAIGLQAELNDPTAFIASVNDTDIDAAIGLQAELEQNTAFTANVNDSDIGAAIRLHNDLESNTSFRADVNDSELDSALRKHADLDANTSMKVNVDDTELDSALDQIKNLQIIEIGVQLSGAAGGLLSSAGNMTGLPGIFEMDDILGNIEGTTGRIIPNLEEIINQLYSEAWGENRAQIGGIVAEASRLNVSYDQLEDATRRAFALSDILGEEPEIILRAMDRMVDEGIAKDMGEAADIFTTTFHEGGNAANDMMDTITEYAPDFAALNMTGAEVGAALVAGMDAGLMNSDLVGDSLKELNIRIDEWARDKESHPIFEELNLWDQTVAYNAGEMGFSEYMSAVQNSLAALPEDQRSAAFLEIFGTPAEGMADDFNVFFDGITTGFEDSWKGSMARASAAVEGDLGTSWTSLIRTIEVELGEALNNALDIDAFIEDARIRFSTFMGEITSGATLGQATETAFGGSIFGDIIDGLESFQSSFVNVIIALMSAVEDVLRGLRQFDEANAISEAIASLAETQLDVDLFTAGSYQEIAADLKTALERGVEEAKVYDLFNSELENAINSGNLSQALEIAFAGADAGLIDWFDAEKMARDLTEGLLSDGNISAALDNLELGISELTAESFGPDMFSQIGPRLKTGLQEAVAGGIESVDERLAAWDFAESLSEVMTGQSGFAGVSSTLGTEASELWNQLAADFDAAIATGDYDLAQRIADTTNVPVLQARVNELKAEIESMEQPIDDTMQASEDATTDFTDTVGTSADDIDTSTEHVKGSYQTVETASGNAKKKVKDDAGDMSTDIDTLATDIGESGASMETDFGDVSTALVQLEKQFGLSGDAILSDFDTIGTGAADLETMLDSAIMGVVDDMSLLIDTTNIYATAAQQSFLAAGDAYSQLRGRMDIDTAGIISSLTQAQQQIAAISNTQISIPTAGGGGVVNNSSTTNNNQSVVINNNSQAAAVASGNAAAQLLGH